MKKLYFILTMAGITFSTSVFAVNSTFVKVPASTNHFFVGLEALYLQAADTNGDLDYANIASGTGFKNNQIESIDTSYQWAWRFIAGYEYGAANDVSLSYFRLRNSDSDNIAVTSPASIFNPERGEIGEFANAYGHVDYEIDQVDVTFGQKINTTKCIILHPFGGLRYARVTRDLDASFNGASPPTFAPGSLTQNLSDNSRFSGIGPLVGMDANINVGNGFKIRGHVDAGILVGNIDDSLYSSTLVSDTTTVTSYVTTGSERRIVPVVDARLGIAYIYSLPNDASMGFELGYQASVYKNAIDKINDNHAATPPGFAADLTQDPTRSTSSLGLNGPYLNVVWRI